MNAPLDDFRLRKAVGRTAAQSRHVAFLQDQLQRAGGRRKDAFQARLIAAKAELAARRSEEDLARAELEAAQQLALFPECAA